MRKYIPKLFVFSLLICIFSSVVFEIVKRNVAFAEWVNSTLSYALRRLMSFISSPVSISLAEIVVMLIPPLFILLIVIAFKLRGAVNKVRYILTLSSVVMIIYSGYLFALAVPYHIEALDEKMNLSECEVGEDGIYNTSMILVDRINELIGEVDFDGSQTRMPYTQNQLSEKICEAYTEFLKHYPIFKTFNSRAKAVSHSSFMADIGLLGIYTYFTGEANYSDAYPDYCLPSTVAHEMAHQRGIIRENEANFVAFMVCISSDDPYIRYSGYINLLEYTVSAVYKTSPERAMEIYDALDARALSDLRVYSAFVKSHSDSFLNKTVDRLNDLYLKSHGTGGTVSYSKVVTLAVYYYMGALLPD